MALDFHSLPIPPEVLRGIDELGFTECTPIQEKVLPLALDGRDVAGQAQTGTGKTAAFLTTIFTRLLRNTPTAPLPKGSPRALVIAPTRELAVQIHQDALAIGKYTGLRMQAVYGGVDYVRQRNALAEGLDLLVGTPGRLIDYFKQRALHLRHVEILVVDEADRMFDMGFIADLRYLLRRLPPYDKRQSMLFSATLGWDVMELAYEHMNDPVKLVVNPEQVAADRVEHVVFHVGKEEKFPLLLGLLQREKPERALVFVNTRRQAQWLAERLEDCGHRARALTGEVDQRRRLQVLRQLKAGDLPILVATDVASRGLHIEGITHVFNYDVPADPEDYVHRVGRTARAGASGRALTLACEDYVTALPAIEELIGFKLPVEHITDEMLVQPAPRRRRAAEGRNSRGGSRRQLARATARRRRGRAATTPAS